MKIDFCNILLWLNCISIIFFSSVGLSYKGEETDLAFAALLSMPTAKPNMGSWRFNIPQEFNPRTEDNLIKWLSEKKKKGANFNEYRHSGTLLHHAIRSNLNKTTIWLLKNGANPRLSIKNLDENALELAYTLKNELIIKTLTQQPYLMLKKAELPPNFTLINGEKVLPNEVPKNCYLDFYLQKNKINEALQYIKDEKKTNK